jgi:hypothetical protein
MELDGCALFDFQPALASALFELDDAYRRLAHHQEVLIRKKPSFSAIRFGQRMRALGQDLEALRAAIRVGRNLGDAFAWTFYQYDQPSLELHFKNPPNPPTPAGIGGRGELEFIKQVKLRGLVVLYHGITTFLRIGDVSFFDPLTGRITGIGELKSKPAEPGKMIVRMHSIHRGEREKIPFINLSRTANNREQDRDEEARFKAVIERQMKKMVEVVNLSEPNRKADLQDAYHIDELGNFAKQLSLKRPAFQRVGKGGVLVGCPFRGKSLSGRIYSSTSQASIFKRMAGIRKRVATICNPELPDNSIFASKLDPGVYHGIPPLFWFPCDTDFLEKIYFMRAIVWTIYNPAYLFRGLRERGYEVHTEYPKSDRPKFEIHKAVSKGVAAIEGFDFYLALIEQRFMREAKIIEGFDRVFREAPKLASGQETRIELSFVHHF